MIELLTTIKTRLETVSTGELFSNPAGVDCEPEIKVGGLDPKRSGSENDEDFPFIVIVPPGGIGSTKQTLTNIKISCGIFTKTNVVDGLTQIDKMLQLVLGIVDNRTYTPYRLNENYSWKFGDEDGLQPHPYYLLAVDLGFKSTPQIKTRR